MNEPSTQANEPKESERAHISVRRAVEYFKATRLHAENDLLRADFEFWGEVLDVQNGQALHFLVLRDKQEDGVVANVTLPAHLSAPRIGDMIGVVGKFRPKRDEHDGALRLSFHGQKFRSVGASQRTNIRMQLVESLQRKQAKICELMGPIDRVVLLTSAHAKGGIDFRSVLCERGRSEIEIDVIHVELDNADHIASQLAVAAKGCAPVVVARGGGSNLSLDVFNHPQVIQAVHDCATKVPLVLAIGHSSDSVLSARFASLDCYTPSEAARRILSIHSRFKASVQREPIQLALAKPPLSPKIAPVLRKIIFVVALAASMCSGWALHAWVAKWPISESTSRVEAASSQRGIVQRVGQKNAQNPK